MIFLDTSFLFPLFARHDPDHQRVRQVMEGYRGKRMEDQVLTTNHVVAETITLVRYKGSRQSQAAHALAAEVGTIPGEFGGAYLGSRDRGDDALELVRPSLERLSTRFERARSKLRTFG